MSRVLICALALIASNVAARAEVVSFVLKAGGRDFDVSAQISRPEKPMAGAPLLLSTQVDDDLAPLAARRGFAVVALDIGALPESGRGDALREIVPRLREATGTKRLLGHGRGQIGGALAARAELFDGLLLDDVGTPAASDKTRVIETWGADAYWRPRPHAAPADSEPQNLRRFFLSGAAMATTDRANCMAPVNGRSTAPALRALFIALDDWTRGAKPPASRAPGAADLVASNTLVWPKAPGLPAPPAGERLVPKIDDDGNELSGLRLPDHALPIATFTGFNAQKDKAGPPCAAGAALAFPTNKAEREKIGDSRLSLVERYGSRAYFVATMRVVADRLVKERLLLQEDADAYVAAAKSAPF